MVKKNFDDRRSLFLSKGFALTEVIVAMAILSVVALTISQLLKSFVDTQKKTDVQRLMGDMTSTIRANLTQNAAWNATAGAAENNGIANIICIRGGVCPAPGGVFSIPLNVLRNGLVGAANQIILDMRGADNGFVFTPLGGNAAGTSWSRCNSYVVSAGGIPAGGRSRVPSNTGNDACPFRAMVTANGTCPTGGVPCIAPSITIDVIFEYNPSAGEGGVRRLGNFNMDTNFNIISLALLPNNLSLAGICASLGGVFNDIPPAGTAAIPNCNLNPQSSRVTCETLMPGVPGAWTAPGVLTSGSPGAGTAGTCNIRPRVIFDSCLGLNGTPSPNSPTTATTCTLTGMSAPGCGGGQVLTKTGLNAFACKDRFSTVAPDPTIDAGAGRAIQSLSGTGVSVSNKLPNAVNCGNQAVAVYDPANGNFTCRSPRAQQGCGGGTVMRGFDTTGAPDCVVPQMDCMWADRDDFIDQCFGFCPDTRTEITVDCPGGRVVMGGGGICDPYQADGHYSLIASEPNSETSWYVRCRQDGTGIPGLAGGVHIRARARCCKVSGF